MLPEASQFCPTLTSTWHALPCFFGLEASSSMQDSTQGDKWPDDTCLKAFLYSRGQPCFLCPTPITALSGLCWDCLPVPLLLRGRDLSKIRDLALFYTVRSNTTPGTPARLSRWFLSKRVSLSSFVSQLMLYLPRLQKQRRGQHFRQMSSSCYSCLSQAPWVWCKLAVVMRYPFAS